MQNIKENTKWYTSNDACVYIYTQLNQQSTKKVNGQGSMMSIEGRKYNAFKSNYKPKHGQWAIVKKKLNNP